MPVSVRLLLLDSKALSICVVKSVERLTVMLTRNLNV